MTRILVSIAGVVTTVLWAVVVVFVAGLALGFAVGFGAACLFPWIRRRIDATADRDIKRPAVPAQKPDPVLDELARHHAATAAALTAARADVPALEVAPPHDPRGRSIPVQDLGSTQVIVPVVSGTATQIPPGVYTRDQLQAKVDELVAGANPIDDLVNRRN